MKCHHLSLYPSLDKTYPWASFSRGARVPRKANRTLIQKESKVSTLAPYGQSGPSSRSEDSHLAPLPCLIPCFTLLSPPGDHTFITSLPGITHPWASTFQSADAHTPQYSRVSHSQSPPFSPQTHRVPLGAIVACRAFGPRWSSLSRLPRLSFLTTLSTWSL